jgi:uncharacterized protein DUF5990
MERELTLRIVLEKPLAGVDFGLQKGRGSEYETIQTQRLTAPGKDLCFEFTIRTKANRAPSEPGVGLLGRRGAAPNFLGPFVQGPSNERFVYVDIGTYAGQTGTQWSRRLKVPLRGITWKMIDQVAENSGLVLETRVPGTGRDGGPNCATVKPFDGWKPVRTGAKVSSS